jgi:sulfate/thiosulfate transport system substrate-binding protein
LEHIEAKEMVWWKQLFKLSQRRSISLALAICCLLVGLNSCTPQNNVEITLVSYTVTKAAYQQIADNFAAEWQKSHQQNVVFNQSYGASGSQSRAVADGLEADVVALSLQPDIDKIQQVGLIDPGWENELPNKSIVSQSVVSLITQPGNPKQIKTWTDLAQPGLKIITANPKSSGVAKWNFLAIWGALAKELPHQESQVFDQTQKIYQNAIVLAKDAREASDTFFKQGQGDVLITYENEAILIGQKGEKLDFVSPPVNISIDNPVAIVDQNVRKHQNQSVVEAFVKYLFTPAAQREFAKVGFRPVLPAVYQEFNQQYQKVDTTFKATDIGSWSDIQAKFFAEGELFDRIEANLKK